MVPALFEFISGRSLWWRHFHFGRSQNTRPWSRDHIFFILLFASDSEWVWQDVAETNLSVPVYDEPCVYKVLWMIVDTRSSVNIDMWTENKASSGAVDLSLVCYHIWQAEFGDRHVLIWHSTAQLSSAQHSSAQTSLSLLFVSGDVYKNASLVLLLLLLCPGPK